MNDSFKKFIDDVDIPNTSLSPMEILRKAIAEKQAKQKRDARIFNWIQGLVICVLVTMMMIHLNAFIWLQLPITLFGVLLLLATWLKGVKKHER